MLNQDEVAMVYETILSTPGMNDTVKMDFKMSRKQVLMLCNLIERALGEKELHAGLPVSAAEDVMGEIRAVVNDWLEKSGLRSLKEKLDGLVMDENGSKK